MMASIRYGAKLNVEVSKYDIKSLPLKDRSPWTACGGKNCEFQIFSN